MGSGFLRQPLRTNNKRRDQRRFAVSLWLREGLGRDTPVSVFLTYKGDKWDSVTGLIFPDGLTLIPTVARFERGVTVAVLNPMPALAAKIESGRFVGIVQVKDL